MSFDIGSAILFLIIVVLVIGFALGGIAFEVIPYLFHHISIHWVS